jgi:hypothetical protein
LEWLSLGERIGDEVARLTLVEKYDVAAWRLLVLLLLMPRLWSWRRTDDDDDDDDDHLAAEDCSLFIIDMISRLRGELIYR